MATGIPATFLLPTDPTAPLQVTFRHEALRMSVVDRDQVSSDVLRPWDVTGFYLLFGPAAEEGPGRYAVYVGKAAPGAISARVRSHVRNREGWDRALLVTRTTDDGFNSTDVGWLEGRLHQLLGRAEDAELTNSTTPGDDTISDWDQAALERVVTLTSSVMRVLGYRPDPPRGPRSGAATEPEENNIASGGLDVDRLHELVAAVKPGEWASYGDVADAAGSHPRALGSHIRHCGAGVPEWRVMNRRGESQPGFVWTTHDGQGMSQVEYLQNEGLAFDQDGRADPDARVRTETLLTRTGRDAPDHGSDRVEPDSTGGGWLAELLDAGLLAVGDRVVGRYRDSEHRASVTAEGSIRLELDGQTTTGSPSLTAREIVGYEVNGWTFWRRTRDGEERSLAELRAELD